MIPFVPKLWGWVVAAAGFALAALLFVVGQRDKARAKVKEVKIGNAMIEANRELERTTNKAQALARKQAEDTIRENQDRPVDKRPDGNFRR